MTVMNVWKVYFNLLVRIDWNFNKQLLNRWFIILTVLTSMYCRNSQHIRSSRLYMTILLLLVVKCRPGYGKEDKMVGCIYIELKKVPSDAFFVQAGVLDQEINPKTLISHWESEGVKTLENMSRPLLLQSLVKTFDWVNKTIKLFWGNLLSYYRDSSNLPDVPCVKKNWYFTLFNKFCNFTLRLSPAKRSQNVL